MAVILKNQIEMLTIQEIWNQYGVQPSETKDQSLSAGLEKSLAESVNSSDFSTFYAALKAHLQIDNIHDDVKAYIESSATKQSLPGPTKFKGCKAYLNFIKFGDLFPGSYDRLFPAFYINSNLWLIIPTGTLLNLNHDATFYEIGTEVLGYSDSFEGFIDNFSGYGSDMSLNQRFHFEVQLSEKGLDNFRRIDEAQQKEVLALYSAVLDMDMANLDVDELDEDVRVACMAYLEGVGLY